MASVVTYPRFKAFAPGTGNPLASGTVGFFAAGTSTPLAVYTDAALTTPAANPATLDANGEGLFYAAAGTLYKLQLKDATSTLVWNVDNVTIAGGAGATTSTEWIASGLTPTFISATSYSFSGDQTGTAHVGRRQKSAVTAGTIYSTITASSFGAGITTVTQANDSGVLDSGLSVVNFGLLDSTNTSIPSQALSAVSVTFGNGTVLPASPASVLLGTTTSGGAIITDALSEFNVATGLFTAKRPGRYLIAATYSNAIAGVTYSGNCGLTIEKNAGPLSSSNGYLYAPLGPLASNGNQAHTAVIVNLTVGDTLGTRLTLTYSAGSPTYGGGMINIGFIA